MALKPDDPGNIELEALAWLLLEAAESEWSLIRRSHPPRSRNRRNDDTDAPLVSSERLAKLLPIPLVLRQPERETAEGEADSATAPVARSDDAARPVSGGGRRLHLSRSQAWATTRPRQVRKDAPRGRYALVAGVAVVLLALSITMLKHTGLKHTGLESARSVPVAARPDAPVVARRSAPPDTLALAAPAAPVAAPAAAPTASVAVPTASAAASPPAPIAVPHSTPRAEPSRPLATMPERAEPSHPDAELAPKTERFADQRGFADQRAEQQNLQSQAKQRPDQAGEASQHLDKRHEPGAQPESRMAAQSRRSTETGHPLIASAPAREPRPVPAARSARELPPVPQRLLLARAALVNRDQRAARGLMEEAQTLITFQPANASPRLSVVAASQLTEALILLGRGDDAGALQRLNQLIEAIRRTS